MLCKIADIITAVPEVGGLTPYLQDYKYEGNDEAEIIIEAERCKKSSFYPADTNPELLAYMQSGNQFFSKVLAFNGFYLHASAVEMDGKAYLFSAYSGTGKSTHTRQWKKLFGEKAVIFNDDKPVLRNIDGTWYAYGTPWCGKDHINVNIKVPVAGICFLKQAPENRIRRVDKSEAALKMFEQTLKYLVKRESLDYTLSHIDRIVRDIPVFELENRPEPEAAQLSYKTMKKAAEEMGL